MLLKPENYVSAMVWHYLQLAYLHKIFKINFPLISVLNVCIYSQEHTANNKEWGEIRLNPKK